MTIEPMNQELKEKLTKNGSHLNFTRNSGGGAGPALITLGAFVLVFGVLIGGGLAVLEVVAGGIISIAIGVLGGGFCIYKGISMSKKQKSAYIEYFMEKSGYTKAELDDFDREVLEAGTAVINVCRKMDDEGCRQCGILTKNWIQLPYMLPIQYSALWKISDVAACWYEVEGAKSRELEIKPSLIFIQKDGKDVVIEVDETVGNFVAAEMAKRNPKMISRRFISFDNKNYDAIHDKMEVAAAYRKACAN